MKEIKLTQGYVALVDDEDFDNVNQFEWHVSKCETKFYARRSLGKRKYQFLHQFIMGSKWIDHIDDIGLNCQKHNLRKCTNSQNQMNSRPRKNTASKYKGVSKCSEANRWQSQIKLSGKIFYLGIFKDEIDAAKAYDTKAIELFGEFAYLNFQSV